MFLQGACTCTDYMQRPEKINRPIKNVREWELPINNRIRGVYRPQAENEIIIGYEVRT